MKPLLVVLAFMAGGLAWYALAQGLIRLLQIAFELDGIPAVLIAGAVLLPATWAAFRFWERRRQNSNPR